MLKAPAYSEINGITLYPDDLLFYKFYAISQFPSIRLDPNGHPVFLLVKYAFGDEDRLTNPNLPAGGGYMNFDLQFEVPAAQLEQVRAKLQPEVDAEWQRLKSGSAADQARSGVAGSTAAPKVEFGEPTWTGGQVTMDAPQTSSLISARVAAGAPSLLAGNIAVFDMDLTSEGATFMEGVLLNPGGNGSDLTPIQVAYDLKFWARLPPVSIHVVADSKQIYQRIRQIMEGRGIDNCTTYDFQHTDTTTETASITGMIDVQIDTGSGTIKPDEVESLRKFALTLVQQMIQSSFFTNKPPAAGSGTPGNDPTPTIQPGDDPKKYLKQQFDDATMHIELHLDQSSVVEWEVHPQATLETFFAGMTPAELHNYVRRIDLEDDFFKHLGLTMRAFTDYSDPNLAAVELDLHYEGRDENGVQQQKDATFTFTTPEPQSWNPSLIGSTRDYQSRYRAIFKNHDAGSFSEWAPQSSSALNVALPAPGRVTVDVLAGDIDWNNLVDRVQVTLAYEDASRHIAREEAVVLLGATALQGHYERLIYDVWRNPVEYKVRFDLKSGEVLDDGMWQPTVNRQIVINQPFVSVLRVSLLPAGDGWDTVVQAIVDLRYSDPANKYVVPDSLSLHSQSEFKQWTVVLKDKTKRDFSYKVTTSFKDGRLETQDWQPSSAETLPIIAKLHAMLKVQVIPTNLDFSTAPITSVTFHYKAAGVDTSETLVFHDKAPQTWMVATPDGAPHDYTYQVTHHPADGDPVVMTEVHEHDTAVILMPYRPPKAGKLSVDVMAVLVDFGEDPLVTVDLRYDDDANQVHEVGSLAFTDKKTQSWLIDVKDVNHKQYGYQITYHPVNDLAAHSTPLQFQEIPRIIIPKS